jgi:hypothetical protein
MAERRRNENDREQREGKQQQSSRSGSSEQQNESGRGSGRQDDSSDLEEREYRDEQGNVHHHTLEYMERHGKQNGGSERS